MSLVIYKCHSSFINVAYVLYFGTNGASYERAYNVYRQQIINLNIEFKVVYACPVLRTKTH